ncbi:MAG TPA: MFS transporter [Chloroflexota bacterium]|nr:MFS transporter [Chloroflexota bacterium]
MASLTIVRRLTGFPVLAAPRWQLTACVAMHVVNDGLFAGVYPLIPLVAADLGLSYAEAGALKTAFSGSSSVLQVPAGMAAERLGEQFLLALGTGWVGVGLLTMAAAAGFWPLLALAVVAGIGGNVQHPVASAVVSRLYDGRGRATAIGTLNFAGDIGKVLAPLLVGLVSLTYGWRGGFLVLGVLGAIFGLLYLLAVPSPAAIAEHRVPSPDHPSSEAAVQAVAPRLIGRWGIGNPRLFAMLTGIGVLDSAARGAALVFVPFLLQEKGADPASMSFYFAVIFAAGAAGKFICGPLGDRFGNVGVIAITELITAGALVGVVLAPLQWTIAALLPLGFVLNGTSSVLYASVASLVHASRRARGYGLYYTCSLVASAAAPIVYGFLADRTDLGTTFIVMAAVTALIVPIALLSARGLGETDGT